MTGWHILVYVRVYLKQMFYFKNHIIPKYNIIAMNELTINYIQLFYILISFEFLIRFTSAYCVVSTSTDTKCSYSFFVFVSHMVAV